MSCAGLVDVGGGNHIIISRVIAVADSDLVSIAERIDQGA